MILEMTATCVSEKIKTKSIELGQRMSYLPSTFLLGENQWVVAFRYGVIVTIGMHEKELQDLFREMSPYLESPPLSANISETFKIKLDSEEDKVDIDFIHLQKLTREHVLVMADILAKTIMLERYEAAMSEVFTEIEPPLPVSS